ncbi:MAG: L-serine dehydratase, alpha chain [Eubacteriales bacterium SKADARSKE-1]|nr:L-serine dehydratase, alpha chain [Eubacteriales bacterium SKADARSKE-1]
MYNNANELKLLCDQQGKKIYEVAIDVEAENSDCTIKEVRQKFREAIKTMKDACSKTLKKEIPSVSGLTSGNAKKLMSYISKGNTILSADTLKCVAHALSCFEVNTSMGKIIAAPTAGSCGILPACIFLTGEKIDADEETLVNAFATAAAIGLIIEKNATLSGAEGGCQAECGSASAMAAAAVVEMLGGTIDEALHAGAMTITNVMGQVCDPIAGLVEIPCAKRNAIGVVNALLCADLALAGITCFVPFDEVIDAMYAVGKALPPELRETGLGGLAATPTGIAVRKKIFGE